MKKLITTLLVLLFAGCLTPEKPETDSIIVEAKSNLRKVEIYKERKKKGIDSVDATLELIDSLKGSIESLIATSEKQETYIDFLEKKSVNLQNSLRYKIGETVIWIAGILGLLLGAWFFLKIYVAAGNPVGFLTKFLK